MNSNKVKIYEWIGGILGAILGLGAPLGGLILRWLFSGESYLNLSWVGLEFQTNRLFYLYMLATTPIIFSAFGYCFGLLLDQLALEKKELRDWNVILKDQSVTDDMTELYNHRYITERLREEIERAKRYGHVLSCAMIDIDGFKEVNDVYGHIAGDQILRQVALLLNTSVHRRSDLLGRYGGDEFLLVLPETTLSGAQTVAEKIKGCFRKHHFKLPNKTLLLSVSIGISGLQSPWNKDALQLIEEADQNLFEAKRLLKSGSEKLLPNPK